MKILFLCHPECDYLQEMTFCGLCSLFGEENIYLYPTLKRFKDNKTPDDWYVLDDGKTGFTSPAPYMKAYPNLPELSIDEICNDIDMFDYIIFFPRTYSLESLDEIKKRVDMLTVKTIFIDGEDGANIRKDIIKAFDPNVIFKREIRYDLTCYDKKVYPLPLSAFTDRLCVDEVEKDVNVFGIFGNTNIKRINMVKAFHKWYKPHDSSDSIVDIDNGVDELDGDKPRHGKMSYSDYMKIISESKIGLSCIGHGRDTLRFWEVPSHETLLMTVNPKIQIPFPFKHKETAIFIKDDLSNFEEMLEYYLTHDDERIKIAKAGHEHLMKYHTTRARAMYLMSIAEGAQ